MATITKQEALHAFQRLGELAAANGQAADLLLLGGGAMVLRFDARLSTKDLDVVILAPTNAALIRGWAAEVAADLSWPDDWLNDAAKGFVVGSSLSRPVFASAGITVRVPATEQLLAMKLCAWRDDVDIADARRLLAELVGEHEDVWKSIEPYLYPGRELTAKYAFDDLWEATHAGN
jgi:hypothetical protein